MFWTSCSSDPDSSSVTSLIHRHFFRNSCQNSVGGGGDANRAVFSNHSLCHLFYKTQHKLFISGKLVYIYIYIKRDICWMRQTVRDMGGKICYGMFHSLQLLQPRLSITATSTGVNKLNAYGTRS